MAGLYVHIPFCKQACSYCNFHFSTSLKLKEPLLSALHLELEKRSEEMRGQVLGSVYFGGGTPSLLDQNELQALWTHIGRYYSVSPSAEVTLEANPDDLSPERLEELTASPINRLSVGIQSFFDDDLRFMRRAHTASDALKTVETLKSLGWNNLTIDLIYGTPTLTSEHWLANLQRVTDFGIPHLSAYQLTVEPRTILEA